jgi:hypothetical protein
MDSTKIEESRDAERTCLKNSGLSHEVIFVKKDQPVREDSRKRCVGNRPQKTS